MRRFVLILTVLAVAFVASGMHGALKASAASAATAGELNSEVVAQAEGSGTCCAKEHSFKFEGFGETCHSFTFILTDAVACPMQFDRAAPSVRDPAFPLGIALPVLKRPPRILS